MLEQDSYADQKTVAQWKKSENKAFVAGWLVCIDGIYSGKSFPIVYGNNLIGSSVSSNISLSKINGIQPTNHCKIIFDPLQKSFYIQSNDHSSDIYINDKALEKYIQLNENDSININGCTFILCTLCNDDFSWENIT